MEVVGVAREGEGGALVPLDAREREMVMPGLGECRT